MARFIGYIFGGHCICGASFTGKLTADIDDRGGREDYESVMAIWRGGHSGIGHYLTTSQRAAGARRKKENRPV